MTKKIIIEADVPDGWEAVAYRRAERGEWILTSRGPEEAIVSCPWLILRRIAPEFKPGQYVVGCEGTIFRVITESQYRLLADSAITGDPGICGVKADGVACWGLITPLALWVPKVGETIYVHIPDSTVSSFCLVVEVAPKADMITETHVLVSFGSGVGSRFVKLSTCHPAAFVLPAVLRALGVEDKP